jgi:hypothetical protein
VRLGIRFTHAAQYVARLRFRFRFRLPASAFRRSPSPAQLRPG